MPSSCAARTGCYGIDLELAVGCRCHCNFLVCNNTDRRGTDGIASRPCATMLGMDYTDMVCLIAEIFKRLQPHQRLWPFSGQTLRDSELVRRRGRWLASRKMEIYLQESAAVTFFSSQLPDTKARILQAAQSFPEVSARARAFLRWSIPSESWWHLLTDRQTGEIGVDEKFQSGSRQMGQPDSVQDANRRGARKRTVHLKSCK